MKKIIPFTKDIKFNTKIYEITSISLENSLVVDDKNEIDGEFIVSGEYKMNDSSINTEPFIYGLPFNISLDDNYETDTIKLDIDDFKYEIINEEILRVKIDVILEGEKKEIEEEINEIKPDVIIEARNKEKNDTSNEEKSTIDDTTNIITKEETIIEDERKDTNKMNNEIDLFKEESNIQTVIKEDKSTSIFNDFDSSKDSFVSYYVHIVRDNDSLESIVKKYNSSTDDIKDYNDISQITLGNKIIIPFKNEESI